MVAPIPIHITAQWSVHDYFKLNASESLLSPTRCLFFSISHSLTIPARNPRRSLHSSLSFPLHTP